MSQQSEAKCVCGRKAGIECGRVDCANRRPLTADAPRDQYGDVRGRTYRVATPDSDTYGVDSTRDE